MLDTGFIRIPGDVGNPATFDYPVRHKIINAATTARIVQRERPDPVLADRFIEAARQLEKQGATGLISSCGYLSVLQDEVARAVSIPVILSSLSLIPMLQCSLGHQTVGVITADETQLSPDAFSSVNINPESLQIAGMESSKAFTEYILNSSATGPDVNRLRHDLETIAGNLLDANPTVSVLVLECTNLQPYAALLNRQFKLPVVGIVNAANLLWEISHPRNFQ